MMKADLASSTRSLARPELKSVWDAPAKSGSAGIDKDFAVRAANIVQTLLCLSNLTHASADDAGKVREYTMLADRELQDLGELMRPALWRQ